jgi:cell division protein FtsB
MASSGASPSQVSPIPAPAVNAVRFLDKHYSPYREGQPADFALCLTFVTDGTQATEQLEELRRRLQAVEAENEELRRQVRQWPPPDPKVAEEVGLLVASLCACSSGSSQLRQKEAELRAVQAAAEQARKQLAVS